MEGAAEGLYPLPHARQAEGQRRAVSLAAGGETPAVVGDDDPEPMRPIGREGDRGLPRPGVLAHVGQGLLDEPEELERREGWELVGSIIRSEAHGNPVPLLELVRVIP